MKKTIGAIWRGMIRLFSGSSFILHPSSFSSDWRTRIDHKSHGPRSPWPPGKDFRLFKCVQGDFLQIRPWAEEPPIVYHRRMREMAWHTAKEEPCWN